MENRISFFVIALLLISGIVLVYTSAPVGQAIGFYSATPYGTQNYYDSQPNLFVKESPSPYGSPSYSPTQKPALKASQVPVLSKKSFFIAGDVTCDGAVDRVDYEQFVGHMYVDSRPLDCPKNADLTQDGSVDVSDLRALGKKVNGDTADDDNDGVVNSKDVCPKVWDPAQRDSNFDGIGDQCEVIA